MNIHIKTIIIGFLALLVGLSSATSPGECKLLCNDMSQSLPRVQMCQSALQSSPASASMNYHHCLKGRNLSLRKTCLPMCMNEEVTLTAFDACSKHYRQRDELTWCRRGYDNTVESMALLLGAQDQKDVTPIQSDESINIATSIEEESLIEESLTTIETVSIESEELPMNNKSVSLVLDDHLAESSSSTSEEKIAIIQVSTIVNKTDDSTALITNSSSIHIDRSLMPQGTTHTAPCLNKTNPSFIVVKDDASFDVSAENELDQPDSKELLPAISHDIVDAAPSIVCIILTSITVVFFASIIIWLSAVHCWTLLVGIMSCLKSTTLGRASLTTRRYIADTLYKQFAVLMMTIVFFLGSGVNTTTSLIRFLLRPIDSLLNIPRCIWRVYGPYSHGRSAFDILFNSNPKQGPKRCKVASTLNAIVQGLLDTGQASLKMTCSLFTSARLVQVLAIISYVLVRSVTVSISEDVSDCLHVTRDAFVDMIRLIRVSIIKYYAIIRSAVVLPFFKAAQDYLYHIQASIFGSARRTYVFLALSYTIAFLVVESISQTVRGCLYLVQASIFGMARRTNVLVVILYTFVHSVAVTVSKTIGCCLYFIRAPILGLARRTYVFFAISYALAYSVVETISKAVRGYIHSIRASIFGMARRIQVSIIISYVLARFGCCITLKRC